MRSGSLATARFGSPPRGVLCRDPACRDRLVHSSESHEEREQRDAPRGREEAGGGLAVAGTGLVIHLQPTASFQLKFFKLPVLIFQVIGADF